ncbi:hypothetical protein [Paenibacillus sp. EKM212P]|nr:hypothetical protein [Paenibacillus sp. EKM212P]
MERLESNFANPESDALNMEDTCGVCAGIFFYLGHCWFTSGKEKVYNKTKVSLIQNNCIDAKMIIILIVKHAASDFPKQHVLF